MMAWLKAVGDGIAGRVRRSLQALTGREASRPDFAVIACDTLHFERRRHLARAG